MGDEPGRGERTRALESNVHRRTSTSNARVMSLGVQNKPRLSFNAFTTTVNLGKRLQNLDFPSVLVPGGALARVSAEATQVSAGHLLRQDLTSKLVSMLHLEVEMASYVKSSHSGFLD